MSEYISAKETAVIVRGTLKRAFPDQTFSVRSRSYSMGSSVDVRWTDGPSTRQVDAIIGQYSGKTFDGMDDSTHYHTTEYQGRPVQFATYAPSTSRDVSNFDEWVRMAREIILNRCVCDMGTPAHPKFGNQWVDDLARGMVYACDFREPGNPLERAFRVVVMRDESAA